MKSRLTFLLRFLLALAAIWLAAVFALDRYGLTDHARPSDVIIVPGSRVYANGVPGPSLRRRADHAANLYARGLAPVVICSGGLGTVPPTEAEAACARVQAAGVPASATLLEPESHSTEENALLTAEIMRARGWRTAIISTDGYHAFRAVLLARRAGIDAVSSPSQLTTYAMNPVERFFRLNREMIALIAYGAKEMLGLPITDLQP